MFTNIDFELYPECCEVAFLPLHDQWVYMIQKNGTSSIRLDKTLSKRILVNDEIKDLDFVDVYIREPKSRFLSGVNTFAYYLLREHPDLDRHTVLWMASNYLFLNRHYLPHIHWLINLSRYLSQDAIIRFHTFEEFGKLVSIDHDADIPPSTEEDKSFILSRAVGLDLWVFADQILRDLAGRQMTWHQVKQHYRTNHTDTWNTITKTAQTFQHVLS